MGKLVQDEVPNWLRRGYQPKKTKHPQRLPKLPKGGTGQSNSFKEVTISAELLGHIDSIVEDKLEAIDARVDEMEERLDKAERKHAELERFLLDS